MIRLGFDNSYRRLPERFHAQVEPSSVSAPSLIAFNTPLARELGLEAEALERAAAEVLSGNRLPLDAEPIALAYAGHQFGNFVPQLGDGRALLLGEVIDINGQRRDIQLKGSGPTPFSRRGDGRAALGPVLREYIVSEAMHALGIPTSRSLAAVSTGEVLYREEALPGAVLTRVAASHVRIGTFQYFAARRDLEALKVLANHVIERHAPDIAQADNRYLALLGRVVEKQAALIARWMNVGFIHGVMNTDNMTVSGETIDYGPCAFLDSYDPARVFSSIDHAGRYAFANQPAIAQWNLARFAETILPLIDEDTSRAIELATGCIEAFSGIFESEWLAGMRAKLGLTGEQEGDLELAQELLAAMHKGEADFTLAFRKLAAVAQDDQAMNEFRALFKPATGVDEWISRWKLRLDGEAGSANSRAASMRRANPLYIPRNHRIEEAIRHANEGDFALFHTLRRLLLRPFEEQDGMEAYAQPPKPEERVQQTFCGT